MHSEEVWYFNPWNNNGVILMITIKDLNWSYKNFSLSIDDLTMNNGINILVGNNGSGKSTLLHLLATAFTAPKGAIQYDGDTMDHNLVQVRSKIGFVPTGIELYQDYTPYKLMLYMSQLKGIGKSFALQQTKELLRVFHLEDVAKKKIKRLSQGMQQRLALAQAFIGRPRYIFLDEPLNFLDIHERKCLLNYLTTLSSQCVIVVATHELNEWEEICHSVLWMNRGAFLFSGSKAMWKANLPSSVWKGELQDEDYDDFSKRHLIVYAGRLPKGLLVKCAAQQKPAPGFVNTPPTMEDAFFIRKQSIHQRS
ncbi:ABC-type multidrug transport system ATPase subunit [Bacillus tianshenii]|uniref:ABC-type multidrug transport system ATPase subunit n=2 Tax=Sutcliffiella tianshenii TaxID=1463404 RepID=A0ABS2P637_9BACI|nr:ABC-type multidrug transport system ATPase subunit [Bacillus tianshenii]